MTNTADASGRPLRGDRPETSRRRRSGIYPCNHARARCVRARTWGGRERACIPSARPVQVYQPDARLCRRAPRCPRGRAAASACRCASLPSGAASESRERRTCRSTTVEPIAIIGMRGRFPGANDLDTYWQNLAEGVESIAVLSQEEMRAAGVPDQHLASARLRECVARARCRRRVRRRVLRILGARRALTDPQHRLFLETCWEALEDAGYDPATFPGRHRRVRRLRAEHLSLPALPEHRRRWSTSTACS